MNRSITSRREHSEQVTARFPYALEIGFFAGLIWGAVRWLAYYFKFTTVIPGFLIEPFFRHDFLVGTGGHVAGYLSFIVFSIVAALLYVYTASKLKGPWPGVVYGLLWFIVLYLLLGPLMGMLPPIGKISWDSVFMDGSVFVLWGVFIGYSISYEFTDERIREKKDMEFEFH